MRKGLEWIRREVVLCVAVVLAAGSALVIPPDTAYLGYIDWDTLLLLFSLMVVTAGLQDQGVFSALGSYLLRKMTTSRQMLFVLVLLPFFSSMLMTNDVALITFVPFGLIVLRMAEQERLLVPLVTLQTVAANLGSMLTPIGNPQNLYLYARAGMPLTDFLALMLPYVLVSGLCLVALIFWMKTTAIPPVTLVVHCRSRNGLLLCLGAFVVCLFGVSGIVPPVVVAGSFLVVLLVWNRSLLFRIDYSLLGTFVALFIFIGNMGRIEAFRNLLESLLTGHEELTAVLSSQVISNVPAALLLSGFTDRWDALLIGCNLGGLGTMIASMASLISYKQVAREYPLEKKRYFLWFTVCNVALLLVLLIFSFLWRSV